uniref:Si:ch73-244f7.3 n=1 Tax=Poecilia formosa TaxID=48698 RepID=A0A096M936_POEFO
MPYYADLYIVIAHIKILIVFIVYAQALCFVSCFLSYTTCLLVPVEQERSDQTVARQKWVPNVICRINKDIYHYVGQDIVIYESIDSFGAMMWPAALALCSFLDNNRDTVDLRGKEVLELGAGTGLVAIVASLLGAAVTATDLPEILGNLQANLMRNTRGLCRHTPQVAPLSWGYDLESTYPSSVY